MTNKGALIGPLIFFALVACSKPVEILNGETSYLGKRDWKLIRQNWPDYEYAAKRTGVPAAMLAAIHKRESDLYKGWYSLAQRKVIKNIGGPFMLDLGPHDFERRIREHEAMIARAYNYPLGAKISHDFRFAVLVAAHHVKAKAKCPSVENCLADAVWGYNGRASWHVDNDGNISNSVSPYVWNDPLRGIRFKMRYRRKDGTVREYLDTRPGVMILYKEVLHARSH